MKKSVLRAALVASIGLSATVATSASADALFKTRSGTVSCGGNLAVTASGIHTQGSFWTVSNRNNTAATVTGVRIYDATGTLIYDSSASGLPPSDNGVIGPGNAVLGPHQTVQYSTDKLLASGALAPLPQNRRPIEFDVDWSADTWIWPLSGALTRVTRSGATGEELSRSGFSCHN